MYFCLMLVPNKAAHRASSQGFESCASGLSTVPALMPETSKAVAWEPLRSLRKGMKNKKQNCRTPAWLTYYTASGSRWVSDISEKDSWGQEITVTHNTLPLRNKQSFKNDTSSPRLLYGEAQWWPEKHGKCSALRILFSSHRESYEIHTHIFSLEKNWGPATFSWKMLQLLTWERRHIQCAWKQQGYECTSKCSSPQPMPV